MAAAIGFLSSLLVKTHQQPAEVNRLLGSYQNL